MQNAGTGQQDTLDDFRIYFIAAEINDVFAAASDDEQPISCNRANVPGIKPSIAKEFFRARWIADIAADAPVAAKTDMTLRPGRTNFSVVVDSLNDHPGRDVTDGTLYMGRLVNICASDGVSLRCAITMDNVRAHACTHAIRQRCGELAAD